MSWFNRITPLLFLGCALVALLERDWFEAFAWTAGAYWQARAIEAERS